jgi:hypothetical protein
MHDAYVSFSHLAQRAYASTSGVSVSAVISRTSAATNSKEIRLKFNHPKPMKLYMHVEIKCSQFVFVRSMHNWSNLTGAVVVFCQSNRERFLSRATKRYGRRASLNNPVSWTMYTVLIKDRRKISDLRRLHASTRRLSCQPCTCSSPSPLQQIALA